MSEFWIFIAIIITLLYIILIGCLYFGIKRIPRFQYQHTTTKLSFSIIIAFRDEAENLPTLLASLVALAYPKNFFEILLVNDASSDDSVAIVRNFAAEYSDINVRVFNNDRRTNAPKKDAINTAIRQSNFDWIVTTDADCQVPKNWLQVYNAFIMTNKSVFVAGLVKYKLQNGFLHQFQRIDWMSLTGVTIGSFGWNKPLMCSGANLAYSKKAFFKVNAFEGNEHIASGDDVFLMQKIKEAYPNRVSFVNASDASVQTKSLDSWRGLYQQRMRWAVKTSSIPNHHIKWVGLVVFTMNILLLLVLLIAFFNWNYFRFFFALFLVKVLFDSLLIKRVSIILHQQLALKTWLLSSLYYPLFSTLVIVKGLFTNYKWKGRIFTK